MRISATIDQTEQEFDVISIDDSDRYDCVSVIDHLTIPITFRYNNGVISDIEKNENVETDLGIILERLINAFREYNESHQMGFEAEFLEENTEVIKPYDPEDIRVRPMVFSAYQVHHDISRGKIDLNPEFQRNFVWSDVQKSLLIESMLLKIPLPAFYFAEDKRGRYQVVDGLQRLTVINQYLNNAFKLKSLQYLHQLEGKYFSEDVTKGISSAKALEEPYNSRIEGTQLNINVIEASSPLGVKYDIFYRINTGGRPLNRQEIRNCFATDRTRRLLKEMGGNDLFNQATGNSVKDTRMDAQELALRFCGFLLYRDEYLGEMNGFLDRVLDNLNDKTDIVLADVKEQYFKSLESARHLFGSYAFRKVLPEHLLHGGRRQFLNKAMFIVWTVLLADIDETVIMAKPEQEFVSLFAEELNSNSALFNALTTGTTDRNNLVFVFEELSRLLMHYLNGVA